jgi:hypothetical protein
LATSFWGVVFLFQFLFYLSALLGNFIQMKGLLGKLLYIPTFLVNSNYSAVLGLYRYLNDSQPHLWKRVSR